jgi:carboxyl-terminal processing protease
MDFGLRRISPGSDEIFGWVRYVLPNSDAASKGVQRGQLFREINGIPLRVSNESLWRVALSQNSFTIGFADFNEGNFVLNGTSVLLQKSQAAENPVYVTNVFHLQEKTIGYLMYNGFYSNFEGHLNQAFGEFVAAGVTDLVLDLRYNSGGSVATATRLASMITGQYTGEIFAKQEWNSKLMNYFNDTNPEQIINRFTTSIASGAVLNSLFLDHLYVLTTSSSASASELLINGLKVYMGNNLVQIGTTTSGKNVGSVTLYDAPSFGTANRNPDHKYAMQPIVLKMVNKDDFGDYQEGLEPQIAFVEDYGNLGVLGTAEEPFLAHALAVISGSDRSNRKHTKTFEAYKDARSFSPFGQEMYIEKIPFALQLPVYYKEE